MLFRKLELPESCLGLCSNCAKEVPALLSAFLDLLFVVILVALGSVPERLLKDSK